MHLTHCKTSIALLFLSSWFLMGFQSCSDVISGGINETKAFSLLKEISVTENIAYSEQGQFIPSLVELESRGYSTDSIKRLNAAKNHTVDGYLYIELINTDAGSVDSNERFAIAAYPAIPGKTGDTGYLLLMDMTKMKFNDEGMGDSKEAIQYWKTKSKHKYEPLTQWPSPEELSQDYDQIHLKTPKEGIEQARMIKELAHPK